MRYYATLGPSCCDTAALSALLRRGVTGFRLNLSHTPLAARTEATAAGAATSSSSWTTSFPL